MIRPFSVAISAAEQHDKIVNLHNRISHRLNLSGIEQETPQLLVIIIARNPFSSFCLSSQNQTKADELREQWKSAPQAVKATFLLTSVRFQRMHFKAAELRRLRRRKTFCFNTHPSDTSTLKPSRLLKYTVTTHIYMLSIS